MRIVRFEDVDSWKEGRKLCKMIYGITRGGEFSRDFGLRDQIRRASVSVVSNIAEGFDSRSNSDFRRFLIYSRRSVSEVKCQLYVALDAQYITQQEFDDIYSQADKVGQLTNGFIRFLNLSKKPANEPTSKPANEPTSKPANEPTNKPANEPTN